MKLGIVVYSNDPETVWNAFRFGNTALTMGDEVRVFLLGKGVEYESLDTEIFKVTGQVEEFVNSGGEILLCSGCVRLRTSKDSETCLAPTNIMKNLYGIVKECDRVITF